MSSPCVVFAANRGYALTNSRSSLIQHFLDSGWEVVLATADDEESRSLCELGAHLELLSINRGGLSPTKDWAAFRRFVGIYKHWQPALIQHFHAKPAIFGSLAAARVLDDSACIVNSITGLGQAFVSGGVSSRLAGLGYSLGMSRANIVIFQNRDDRCLFLKRGWATSGQARLIASSGVDLDHFALVERTVENDRPPVVVMLSRLLKQKGIPEFAAVAERIRHYWPRARFLLAGEEEPDNPDSVRAEWLTAQGAIEYQGRLQDVRPLLAEADLFLFPSYYREGVPRVILEAAATGLPTVGFDVPGVREAVRDGQTGYLVPDRDVDQLTDRVKSLLEDKAKRIEMGVAARRMVEESFDIRAIDQQYLDVYRELGIDI